MKMITLKRTRARDAIVVNERDNVATATGDLASETEVSLQVLSENIHVKLNQSIPFGHKFAIGRIPKGGYVIKYGETIGTATQKIESGEHVHIHNVRSERGRRSLS